MKTKAKIKTKIFLSLLFCMALYFIFSWYPRVDLSNTAPKNFETLARQANKNEKFLNILKPFLDPAFFNAKVMDTSELKLDVVMNLVEKDLETAVYSIKSIRDLLMHPIGKIFIVGPNKPKLQAFAEAQGAVFVNEADVLEDFQKIKPYGGWMIQQFLKLSMDRIVEQKHYLVVDADTVFLRPVLFEYGGKYLINIHWDCSIPRKKLSQELLGHSKLWLLDFVSHHMLFSKTVLKNMRNHMESLHKKPWIDLVLEQAKSEKLQYFSEYDLYMQYLTEFSKQPYKLVSNANLTVHRNSLPGIDAIMRAYSNNHKSLSMHHFILRKK
ncbi:MAG: DUF6492 family protein [Gammaproteobacteria bacterium]